jgi:holo-[acyl-carrier protein] synthase
MTKLTHRKGWGDIPVEENQMPIVAVGTHIVECLRIAQLIERHGELFISRVYTPLEIEYCSARLAATQHYSAHWAAKEAVLKVLGPAGRPGAGVHEIEIRNLGSHGPTVVLRGAALAAMGRAGISKFHASLSHCRSHAVAYVIAEGTGRD